MIWQVNLASTTKIHGASKSALQLEGDRARSALSISNAKGDRNNNTLAVTVNNNGATLAPVSDFDKMDVFVFYDSAAQPPVRLTYTATNPPPAGQWTKTSLSGSFEPDIWNPTEDLSILATLVGASCAPGTVTVGFPNGITDTSPFVCVGLDLTFHSETTNINGTTYYTLKSETPADGTASTVSVVFPEATTGRRAPTSNAGKFVFPLTGVNVIPAANWDLTYRVKRDKVNAGWTWFTNAVDISIGAMGAWTDIDLSSNVPPEATGVVVEVVNTNQNNDYTGVVRAKQDVRDYMSNASFQEIYRRTHRWQIVKLDSSRVIQGHVSSLNVDFKLLGYTIGSDPAYLMNGPLSGTMDIRVSTGNDDAEECLTDNSVITDSTDLDFVEDNTDCSGNPQELGMRFQSIPIPPGSTITNAYIMFWADANDSGATNLTFYGEAIDDATGFSTTASDITNRTKTAASVAWNSVPTWSKNNSYQSVDLSTIIQEIIDRSGWATNNDLVVIANGSGTRVADSFEGSSLDAPLLHVEYLENVSNPPDISPAVLNIWTTIDVSNWVSANADGVILLVDSQATGQKDYRIRTPGSDEQAENLINNFGNTLFFVGLNTLRHFEAYIADATTKIYLIGETKGSVGYYATEILTADPATGSWQEMDADDYGIPTAASGLILHFDGQDASSDDIGFRHGGSTDDWNKGIFNATHYQAAIGLRSPDNVWEEYMSNTGVEVWITGYTRSINLDVVTNVDIIVRKADNTIRLVGGNPYILSAVAPTTNIDTDTWQTQTITFAFPGYTVVDPTDYLEIDIYAEATSNLSGETISVDFRIDDPALATADQMRVVEVVP
ncbi:MAG: hypothetical protein J4N75_03520 [Chloroflexi bacterium]|nr:hypothetical protein [Chloroflexota bacterium]